MSDSVGRISLEIDLSGSLDRQINTMATNIGSQLSSTIEQHVRGSLGGVNRMLSSVRMPSLPTRTTQPPQVRPPAPTPTVDIEATRAQIASLGATLDNVNGKLDYQRRKLDELRASFASTYNVTARNRLEGQILNTEAAILRLTTTSDRTASQIWELEDSLSDTAETATEASVATDQLSNSLDRSNRSVNRSNNSLNQSNNSLNRTSVAARQTGRSFNIMGIQANSMGNSVSRTLTRILKQVFVFTVLYQAIRGFTSYVGSALKTNDQFMHSLNQVRTNLQVAFMPIYQAIIPALNALMSALATVTAYIASFVSMLFGKTYKQSFKAAEGLNAAKTAMQGFGSASKKAAKDAKKASLGLAGFDEINSLAFTDDEASGADDGAGGGGGADGGIAPLVMPDLDTSVIDGKMATLIGGIQAVLQPSIDALKRLWEAMDPFKAFVAQGATDFFNNFLKPVGSWVMGEGIPRLIDALANGFGAVNWPIINDSLNRLWEVLTPFAINVGEGLLWFWENVLVPLGAWTVSNVVPAFLNILSGAIKIVNSTIEALAPLAAWLFAKFLKPLASWGGGIIVTVLGWIGEALSVIGDWIKDNQKWVESIAIVILSFAAAWGVVTLALKIWTAAVAIWSGVSAIAAAATTLLGAAVAFLTSPITIAILIIGSLIAIGVLLYKNWDEVSAFLKAAWTAIKVAAKLLFEATKKIIVDVFKAVSEFIVKTWDTIKTYFSDKWEAIKKAAETIFEAIKKLIVDKFIAVSKSITDTWTAIKTFIDTTWNALKTSASTVFNAIKTTITTVFDGVKTFASTVWSAIRKSLTDTWDGIKTSASTIFTTIKESILGAFDGVKNKMTGIWSDIWTTIKTYINKIIGGFNGMISGMNKLKIDIPDWVPGMGGGSLGFSIPNIPMLAKGGIVDQPTLAMVGEAGKEAVMPLENNTGWINNLAGQIAGQMGGSSGELQSQGIIEVLFMILAALERQNQSGPEPTWKLDGTTFARLIGPYLQAELQRMGSSLIQPI